jgi:hypothetical protein
MRTHDRNTRIIDLTLGELLDAIDAHLEGRDKEERKEEARTQNYVYGLRGLSELLHCSKSTANRIKQSGKIDEAVTQVGQLILIDAAKALELLGK